MNFIEPIFGHARVRPNAPALILPKSIVRYAQLDSFSHSIASQFLRAGISPGDAVVVGLGRKDLAIYVTLALARLGAVSVAMNVSPATPRDWAARLGCKAVCRTEEDPLIDGVSPIVFDPAWLQAPVRLGPPPAATEADAMVRIALSSGTTGSTKAIPWTHYGAAQRIIGHQFGVPVRASDRLLFLTNLNTGFGFNACFSQLYVGGAIVPAVVEPFADFVATVDRNTITQTVISAFDLSRLLASAPEGVPAGIARTAVSFAGAALAEPIWRKAAQLFSGPVLSNYGATETGPTAFGELSLLDQHRDAVGRIVPWVRIDAVDDNDRPLRQGEQGVLRVRAPGMASGYFNDPVTTSASFRDGWFYPGDVGVVTIDGIVRVIGRSDDLFNLGGVKISPTTVENALAGAPQIRDVAAAALQEPNGQPSVGVAVVADTPIDQDDLAGRCRAVVPKHLPVHVVQLDAIPRNEAGKILRRDLAALIRTARAAKP